MAHSDSAFDRAETLLSACATATQRAEYHHLPPLLAELEEVMGRLRSRGDRRQLSRLQHRIAENQRLLAAAQSGIRAAARRIAEVTSAARGMGTYDMLGRRENLRVPVEIERKA